MTRVILDQFDPDLDHPKEMHPETFKADLIGHCKASDSTVYVTTEVQKH